MERTYHTAIICALPSENAAMLSMLDSRHTAPPNKSRIYITGSISSHNVVIAPLPSGNPGILSASAAAHDLKSHFPSIKHCLVVGIAGGIPSTEHDIRLGDVVVSVPSSDDDAVRYYGRGRAGAEFRHRGRCGAPSDTLLTAVAAIRADIKASTAEFQALVAEKGSDFARPSMQDILFESEYIHQSPDGTPCHTCDISHAISRPARPDPQVHFGTVISSNVVIASAAVRDTIHDTLGGLCVETEAAGVMDVLPSLVVRGISDYADSHKCEEWQRYASLTACAFARVVISKVPVQGEDEEKKEKGKQNCTMSFNNSNASGNVLIQGYENRVGNVAFHTPRQHEERVRW